MSCIADEGFALDDVASMRMGTSQDLPNRYDSRALRGRAVKVSRDYYNKEAACGAGVVYKLALQEAGAVLAQTLPAQATNSEVESAQIIGMPQSFPLQCEVRGLHCRRGILWIVFVVTSPAWMFGFRRTSHM